MKTFYISLLAIAIAVILYLLLKPVPDELKDINVTQLTNLQNKLKDAETKRTEIIVKAKQDSVKHDSVTKVLDSEIARLKRSARKSRTVHVDTVLIQDKEVGRYTAMLDSIVVSQDSQIAELKEQKVEQWNDFNKLITASDSVENANKELNKYFQNTLDDLNKANKKLKRQNTGLKIGIVAIPLGVVALVLAK